VTLGDWRIPQRVMAWERVVLPIALWQQQVWASTTAKAFVAYCTLNLIAF